MTVCKTYQEYCDKLSQQSKLRKLIQKSAVKNLIDFSTNDYLGFSRNTELIHASIQATEEYGVGSTGARLLSGNYAVFEKLEQEISESKGSESALIFNSGFQANLSVLAALLDSKVLGEKPIVFFDRLNHASLYQAVFLSGAELVRFKHQDYDHLERLLSKYDSQRPKFIVAETLYGMDGDLLDLQKIVELANHFRCFLYLDEAHATGVFGRDGYGLSTTVNLDGLEHVVMGTFSKGLGVSGAYLACSQEVKSYLINKAAGFIYSTAMPPALAAVVSKAWGLLPEFCVQREGLLKKATELRNHLKQLGFDVGLSESQIIPVVLGEESKTLEVKNKLQEQGIVVSAIRPPTVPPGTSRLRIALTIEHSDSDIDRLLEALKLYAS